MRCAPPIICLLLVLLFWSTATNAQVLTIEVEINNTALDSDDYIGWTPVRARIRQQGGTALLSVQLESTKRNAMTKSGEVSFAPFSAAPPTPATFTPVDTLTIDLPASGGWKEFWVAGKESSADGKDVKIVVKDGMNTVLKEHALMVRVRKNAETLTDIERDRFLTALAQLHDTGNQGLNSKYLKYVKAHDEAFGFGIHNNPAFTPWHRAMLLSLERELQAIDPRVALPYWKFEEPAPKLFHRDFLGRVTSSSSIVQFSATNPMADWTMPSLSAIALMPNLITIPPSTEKMRRGQNASATTPPVDLDSVLDATNHTEMRFLLESNYHNDAHNHIGGWLATGASPRDPLFFLLHANVDRAWGLWQKKTDRFDPDGVDSLSYEPLGTYPGPGTSGRRHYGNYVQDIVWPWNGSGGNQGTADTLDDWPNYAFPMPSPFAHHGPANLLMNLVDYLDVKGKGLPHGFCYDDIR